LSPTGLTEHDTTFGYRDVLRAWCEQLRTGAPITTIERLAQHTMDDSRVVPLDDRGPYPAHSTDELVALEARLVKQSISGSGEVGIASEDAVGDALAARPELSAEQVAMIVALTTSGRPVDVVVSAAGTGKTFSLDA